jgi:predicted transcriptional regulator
MVLTGMQLKVERVKARVSIQELATRMGRHRATVTRYEGLEVVPADIVREYLDALGTSRDIATAAEGTAA